MSSLGLFFVVLVFSFKASAQHLDLGKVGRETTKENLEMDAESSAPLCLSEARPEVCDLLCGWKKLRHVEHSGNVVGVKTGQYFQTRDGVAALFNILSSLLKGYPGSEPLSWVGFKSSYAEALRARLSKGYSAWSENADVSRRIRAIDEAMRPLSSQMPQNPLKEREKWQKLDESLRPLRMERAQLEYKRSKSKDYPDMLSYQNILGDLFLTEGEQIRSMPETDMENDYSPLQLVEKIQEHFQISDDFFQPSSVHGPAFFKLADQSIRYDNSGNRGAFFWVTSSGEEKLLCDNSRTIFDGTRDYNLTGDPFAHLQKLYKNMDDPLFLKDYAKLSEVQEGVFKRAFAPVSEVLKKQSEEFFETVVQDIRTTPEAQDIMIALAKYPDRKEAVALLEHLKKIGGGTETNGSDAKELIRLLSEYRKTVSIEDEDQRPSNIFWDIERFLNRPKSSKYRGEFEEAYSQAFNNYEKLIADDLNKVPSEREFSDRQLAFVLSNYETHLGELSEKLVYDSLGAPSYVGFIPKVGKLGVFSDKATLERFSSEHVGVEVLDAQAEKGSVADPNDAFDSVQRYSSSFLRDRVRQSYEWILNERLNNKPSEFLVLGHL